MAVPDRDEFWRFSDLNDGEEGGMVKNSFWCVESYKLSSKRKIYKTFIAIHEILLFKKKKCSKEITNFICLFF